MSPEMKQFLSNQIKRYEQGAIRCRENANSLDENIKTLQSERAQYFTEAEVNDTMVGQFKALLDPKSDGPVHVVGHPQTLSKEQSTQLRNSLEALMGGTVVILDGGATLYPPR